MRKILSGLFCCLFLLRSGAQNYDAQRSQVFLVNVLSNALIGGVGGLINKEKEEKAGRAFVRNFLKGGAGGLVKYTAKQQLYHFQIPDKALLAPLNRLHFFLGHSMVMNASYNRPLLERYYCNFYGIDIRLSLKEEQKFQARLSVATLGSALYMAAKGFHFNLYTSLEYGLPVFDIYNRRTSLKDGSQAGFNTMAIERYGGHYNYSVVGHELAHTYQMYDYFGFTSFYDRKARKYYEEKKIYRALSKYLVLDYEMLFFGALYLSQPRPLHFRNYYEFEAEHFAHRRYIMR